MQDDKAQAILKIFLRYPSILSLPVSEKQGMTAAYLEDCDDLTAEEIAAGFARYRAAGSPYPPSGPELRKHGLDVRADRIAKQRAETTRLPAKPRGADAATPEERENFQRRYAEIMAQLKSASVQ